MKTDEAMNGDLDSNDDGLVAPIGPVQRSDAAIAKAAISALCSNVAVPAEGVNVLVRDGWITLEGNVAFRFQKRAAEAAVQTLWGVRGITNALSLLSTIAR